ncbi:HAD-IIIA family hydrolase [Ornithinibacillus contaminans]|uniref:HAD-IIIA family hydrolase n=1 Tax=Ornithinibacillus contaminans TaxID=694055 RepID=UPI00064DD467|nr:HAD-IIIA family hydrolase [Ornithinibacillus contaminans]
MVSIEAVFLDRDGTIGGDGHFKHPRDFELYPYSAEAFRILREKGLKLFSFTNQHRIGRGEVSINDFKKEFNSYGFDDVFICPHRMEENCDCRKPKPGMLRNAAQSYDLKLENCIVIGDVGSTDMLAAEAVGAIKILVRTGWGNGSLHEYRHTWSEVDPDYIAEDLLDAVKWITEKLI